MPKAARRRMKERRRRAIKRKRYVRELRANKPCKRNDPCYCGSGKKFKRCCMRTRPAPVQEDVMTRKQLVKDIGASVSKVLEGQNVA